MCQRLLRQPGLVVLRAEVCRDHAIQTRVPNGRQDAGSVVVGQMPMHTRNASLQKSGIAGCCEHVRVVVGLQQQRVATLQLLQHMGARVAQVGKQAKVRSAIGAAQLQRFPRIVRHGKGHCAHRAEIDGNHVVGHLQQPVKIWRTYRHMGAAAHKDGNAVPHCHGMGTADMVCVFMRDENNIDLVDAQPRRTQPGGKLPDAETAVHQQAAHLQSVARFHHGGVA